VICDNCGRTADQEKRVHPGTRAQLPLADIKPKPLTKKLSKPLKINNEEKPADAQVSSWAKNNVDSTKRLLISDPSTGILSHVGEESAKSRQKLLPVARLEVPSPPACEPKKESVATPEVAPPVPAPPVKQLPQK